MKNRKNSIPAPVSLGESVAAMGPGELTVPELQLLLANPQWNTTLAMIDVRPSEEFALGHVPGSANHPFHEIAYDALVEQMHAREQAAGGPSHHTVLFLSAQSPDIDDLAAREYINAYERGTGAWPHSASVRILLGGVSGWTEAAGASKA